ncbi:MAG: 4Fe-4S dicluster domain-containing protein [Bryobacteraceae bacterium]|jgi:heterodisulfide reductase subunit C
MTGGIAPPIEIESIGGGLAFEVKERSGASPMNCYQCGKCSSGCPVAAAGDFKPHQLVRMVQTDQRQAVLSSRFIWQCTSCQTCTTRCPQQVDIAGMIDALRGISRGAGSAEPDTAVPIFNEIFLDAVRERGRIFELGLMAKYKLRTKRLFEDAGKAPMMLLKGKLPLSATRVGGKDERDALFGRAAEGGAQ